MYFVHFIWCGASDVYILKESNNICVLRLYGEKSA